MHLPGILYAERFVDLPKAGRDAYRNAEKSLFQHLDENPVLALSGSAVYTQCRQICNGACYVTDPMTNERSVVDVHDAKLDALEGLIEDLCGERLLIGFQFTHDRDKIVGRFGSKVLYIDGSVSGPEAARIVEKWNRREVEILACQVQSLSHGINLQFGGSNACWYGVTDLPEVYQQFNARLRRPGQQASTVVVHHLICRGTIEEKMLARLQSKVDGQMTLLQMLREFRDANRETENCTGVARRGV